MALVSTSRGRTGGPFANRTVLAVHHPVGPKAGVPFAAISFAGFVGVVTGFSQTIAMSEKVWETYRTPDVQPGTYEGMSLVVVIREMLQFGGSRAEAIAIAERAQRTWAVFLGVGGEGSFSALGYRHASLDVFGAANMSTVTNSPDPAVRTACVRVPCAAPLSRVLMFVRTDAQAGTAGKGGNAPPLADLVYIDRHPQPSSDPTLHTLCAATAACSPHTLSSAPSASHSLLARKPSKPQSSRRSLVAQAGEGPRPAYRRRGRAEHPPPHPLRRRAHHGRRLCAAGGLRRRRRGQRDGRLRRGGRWLRRVPADRALRAGAMGGVSRGHARGLVNYTPFFTMG